MRVAAPTGRSRTRTQSSSGEGVKYSVKTKKGPKEILKGIDGGLGGGELCAIMGPSGSGKTSLLNVLAGRIRGSTVGYPKVEGRIEYNGKKIGGAAFRKRIAYVMQQDLLVATQTPREAIMFSAMLRLPAAMPLSEKRALVETMIVDLGLTDCADTFCGDDMIRGISGGEKKRTSIGIELVMRPNLIFLDEPTSGLDSFAAKIVIAKLVELAVHAGKDVHNCFAQRDDDTEELLRRLEERAVLLERLVDLDELGASKQLHHHRGGDDRRLVE